MSDEYETFEQELIRIEKHLNSHDESIRVAIHPDDMLESSTVEKHPKEHLKLSKAEKRPKNNLRFRKRNGAAYQVPDNWEELYDEAAKAGSTLTRYDVKDCITKHPLKPKGVLVNKRVAEMIGDASKESDKNSDYYTSLQKEIRADLQFADYKGYKYTPRKGNSRWKRKHLEEIEKDKRDVTSWFESGIVYKAEAPRQTRQDPESDGIDPDAFVEMPKSKTLTLGDYFPTIPVKSAEDVSNVVKSKESDSLSDDNNGKNEEVFVFTNFETRPTCFKERCKSYFDNLGKSYPDCSNSNDELKSEEPTSDKLKEIVKHSIDNILNPNEKTHKRKEIPLCLHGYNYHVKHLSDSIFVESELMMEIVPKKRLYDFSETVKTLIKLIEDLRSLRHSRKFYRCLENSCIWNFVEKPNEKLLEIRKINPFAKPIYDLASLETRVYQLSDPRYGLTILLKDEYNPNEGIYTQHLLGEKYKKALETQETVKSKGFDPQMERFVVSMFATITTMREFMEMHELHTVVTTLTSSLFDFHGHAWALRRVETIERCSKLRCCGPLFRSRKVKDLTANPDSGADFNMVKLVDFADQQVSVQSQPNLKTVPKQYCPRVECISPSWTYQPGENANQTQDLDPTERETITDASFIAPNKQSTSENNDEVERASF